MTCHQWYLLRRGWCRWRCKLCFSSIFSCQNKSHLSTIKKFQCQVMLISESDRLFIAVIQNLKKSWTVKQLQLESPHSRSRRPLYQHFSRLSQQFSKKIFSWLWLIYSFHYMRRLLSSNGRTFPAVVELLFSACDLDLRTWPSFKMKQHGRYLG